MSLSRRTVAGLITTSGRQFRDWSADYRLLAEARLDPAALFGVVRRGVVRSLAPDQPIMVALDDTVSRKKGRHVPGTAWRRDPMSPPFQANFVWGRRFIQVSGILPPDDEGSPGRAIPIDFVHAPTPKRPPRTASPETWAHFRDASRATSLTRQGVACLTRLRATLDEEGASGRPLWVTADGSYTNGTMLTHLPPATTLIGRIRSDAELHGLPPTRAVGAKGRTRRYGVETVTPDGLRLDERLPWQTASVYAAGSIHQMRYKTSSPLLWRSAGPDRHLRVVVIAPLAYRLSRASRLLYRKPAFLICTDPHASPEAIIKAYVSRWDIEVNLRDEKQLLGLDEAQVRTEASARLAPALAVASYAVALLAATRAFGVTGCPTTLPRPKWRQRTPRPRASTADLLNHLRFELWGRGISIRRFSNFASTPHPHPTSQKHLPSLEATLFYAQPRA